MKSRRIKLKKEWHDRRSRKILKRKSKNRIKKITKHNNDVSHVIGAESLNYFFNKGFKKKISTSKKIELTAPRIFAMDENVDETLEFLKKVIYAVTRNTTKSLFIDYSKIEKISLSASLILDLILMDAQKYAYENRYGEKFEITGKLNDKSDISVLLKANGFIPHLGFDVKKDDDVVSLDFVRGKAEVEDNEDAASKILIYFKDCIKKHKYELTREAEVKFAKLLGEVIDNCTLHPGENGRWYALGFYHHKGDRGICHIAIVSLGRTIYESFKKSELSDEMRKGLSDKYKMHAKYFDDNWNEETLYTWLSLQNGVSRMRDSKVEENSNRGVGTVDMMESFQTIGKGMGKYKPIFNIVSGNASINFDFDQYPIETMERSGDKHKIITFNKEKSLDFKPDNKNVYINKNYFPGTIFTMEFCIDPKYLENSKQGYLRRND